MSMSLSMPVFERPISETQSRRANAQYGSSRQSVQAVLQRVVREQAEALSLRGVRGDSRSDVPAKTAAR